MRLVVGAIELFEFAMCAFTWFYFNFRTCNIQASRVCNIKPNTHRRCRRDETVESRRVGGVYTNSQLVGDSFVVSSVWTHPSAVVKDHGRRLRCAFASTNPSALVANSCTHRRRRRDATKQFRLVGVVGVYWALGGDFSDTPYAFRYLCETRVRHNPSFTMKIIFTTWWAIYIVRVYSFQIIGWNMPEWGGIFYPQDRLFHLMSCDGGNIVFLHPRVEYSTFFIYSVLNSSENVQSIVA